MTPIEQLIDDANPIADPRHEFDDGDVRALLTLTLERNADMDMKEVTRPVGPEPRPTRWWVAAAAFISVVAVAGAALLIFNGDSGAPASPDEIDQSTVTTVAQTTTTQEAAPDALVMTETMEAFIVAFPEAFNRRDIDAYRAMFDPAAVRSDQRAPELGVGVDRLVEEANDLWNQESAIALSDCVPSSSGVSCLMSRSGPVEDGVYGGPIQARNLYSLDTDGKIVKISMGAVNVDGRSDVEFRDWLTATQSAQRLVRRRSWVTKITASFFSRAS